MRVYACGCTEYREDETAAARADGTDLLIECHGPCAAHRPAPERHEVVRLFTPAPATLPGQLGLDDVR